MGIIENLRFSTKGIEQKTRAKINRKGISVLKSLEKLTGLTRERSNTMTWNVDEFQGSKLLLCCSNVCEDRLVAGFKRHAEVDLTWKTIEPWNVRVTVLNYLTKGRRD